MKPLLADRMLGKLARLLRMVGHDVEYVREGDPLEIARRAQREGRAFLTRDRRLAMRKDLGETLFVENNYPFHQARQVLRDLQLGIDTDFRRCVEDNGTLELIDAAAAKDRVPVYVLDTARALFRCDRCGRIYWEGTHVAAMRQMIGALQDAPLVPGGGVDEPGDEGQLRTLEPLVDLHQAFDVLFLRHRLALMDAEIQRALQLFRRFAMCMRRHIEDEKDLVLPVYAGSAPKEGYERGSAPEIFENEHRKILEHLESIEHAVEELGRETGDLLRARCLQLLDREKVFGDLLEHHDLRERTFLYPALERMLTEVEKLDLLERMAGSNAEESWASR
jgi:uncharacterized protein with PIN domain